MGQNIKVDHSHVDGVISVLISDVELKTISSYMQIALADGVRMRFNLLAKWIRSAIDKGRHAKLDKPFLKIPIF